MRAVRRILLLAVALGAVLVAVEIAVRAAGVVPMLRFSDVPHALAVPDRKLGYALPPSQRVSYAGVETTLDANGFRNPTDATAGPTSVLVLGDERTFGWGVADDETYPSQLQALIAKQCPTCGRVVNAGVPGYSTYEGMMLARDLGARLKPRTVVAAFGLNDALLDGAESATVTLPPPWARASVACGWLYEWLRRPGSGWWEAVPRAPLARYARNVRALVSEIRRYGATPVLLNIGYAADLPDPGADAGRRLRRGRLEDDYHATARVSGELEYAPMVDFIGPELDASTMLDAIHPSARGHRQIAARLAEKMTAEGLVSP